MTRTTRRAALSMLALAAAAAAMALAPGPGPGGAAVAQAVAWSAGGTQSATWQDTVQAAAAWTGGGFTDWRLPTVAEVQAAVGNGTIPSVSPGLQYWTSYSQGTWSRSYQVSFDSSGRPVGATFRKVLKSSRLDARFVRP